MCDINFMLLVWLFKSGYYSNQSFNPIKSSFMSVPLQRGYTIIYDRLEIKHNNAEIICNGCFVNKSRNDINCDFQILKDLAPKSIVCI